MTAHNREACNPPNRGRSMTAPTLGSRIPLQFLHDLRAQTGGLKFWNARFDIKTVQVAGKPASEDCPGKDAR
jgi:hypothetical protein